MKRVLFLLLVSVLLAACAPSGIVATPDPAKIMDWETFVGDSKFVYMTIGSDEEDQVVWTPYTIDPGHTNFIGLRAGSNLVGFRLGQNVIYEITSGLDVHEYNSFAETQWFMITVPAGVEGTPGIYFQASP